MKKLLVNPIQCFQHCTDYGKKQAGKKPAHHLCIDVVFARLPVGIDAQAAKDAADGTDNKYQIRKAVVPSVHLTAGTVEFLDAWLAKGT